MTVDKALQEDIVAAVSRALAEDVGSGDVTAELIPESATITATVMTRELMTLAGRPWVDEVLQQVDSEIGIDWSHNDSDVLDADTQVCKLRGPARSILTAERTALNFLQFLSAAATTTAKYVAAVAGTECQILDTRKTVPGLRLAQKYAVACGGGVNHRIGLFDAILIKENHIMSAGGITAAIAAARKLQPGMTVEVEVESIDQLREALAIHVERLLLDNFTIDMLRDAVAINRTEGEPPAELEASGGVTIEAVREIAETGVDYVSVGALTKHVRAVDLSMRFDQSIRGK